MGHKDAYVNVDVGMNKPETTHVQPESVLFINS